MEVVATGRRADQDVAVVVYQVLLADAPGSFVLFLGQCRATERETCLPMFRGTVDTYEPK